MASAVLGWHGLEGDRRFAFRRRGDASGFPWLSASRLPELLLYRPDGLDESGGEPLPTHARTPEGSRLELGSPELDAEIGGRLGSPVELMRLRQGVFDEAPVSVIALATIEGIAREAGRELDRRRFRANVVVETDGGRAFLEDAWVGGTLVFGDGEATAAVGVTMRDRRCAMINLDPDTAERDPRVMKAVVRLHENDAGVYATVVARGAIRVGDRVRLAAPATAAAVR
jgi:uncharacterized protein YcbX